MLKKALILGQATVSFLRVFRAFSNVSAFSTKVENADMTKNFLFYRFYAFSEYFLMCPRFPLKWKMRTRLKISFLCPLSAVRCPLSVCPRFPPNPLAEMSRLAGRILPCVHMGFFIPLAETKFYY